MIERPHCESFVNDFISSCLIEWTFEVYDKQIFLFTFCPSIESQNVYIIPLSIFTITTLGSDVLVSFDSLEKIAWYTTECAPTIQLMNTLFLFQYHNLFSTYFHPIVQLTVSLICWSKPFQYPFGSYHIAHCSVQL